MGAELRHSLRRAVLAADPASAKERHVRALAERRVELWPADDGMAELHTVLSAEEALAVWGAIDTFARQQTSPARAGDGDGDGDGSTGNDPGGNDPGGPTRWSRWSPRPLPDGTPRTGTDRSPHARTGHGCREHVWTSPAGKTYHTPTPDPLPDS